MGLRLVDQRAALKTALTSPGLAQLLTIFEGTKEKSTFRWNSIIQSCCREKFPELAFSLFARMMGEGKKPNFFTYPSLFCACSRLETSLPGSQVHCNAVKLGFIADMFLRSSIIHMYSGFGDMAAARSLFDEWPLKNVVICTALVNGYAKKGDMERAREVFDLLLERDSVTWSALVAGYVQNGRFSEGLELFREMVLERVEATEGALVSALSACASLGALSFGRWIHCHLKERVLGINLGTALVDMYAKCGELSIALEAFEAMEHRNSWTWNAMIGGFALHGCGREASALLSRMLKSGFSPDKVTFLGLLSAFSHGGMMNEGKEAFNSMRSVFGMEPELEHYACLVDILARAGSLKEAKIVVQEMPIEPDAVVWGALLGGCRLHGNIDIGVAAGKILMNFDPGGTGRYALLSNIFAAAKKWEDARSVRSLMLKRGLKPQAGISSVEISGVVQNSSLATGSIV